MNRAVFALLASAVIGSALSESTEPTRIRITTWNLQWFPNGSVHDAPQEKQAQRIKEAADVLRPINPDIILLQEVRDYEASARLGEAIAPRTYHVAICSAFKEPFQSGLGKQQVAILSKYQAQAAWSERWKLMSARGRSSEVHSHLEQRGNLPVASGNYRADSNVRGDDWIDRRISLQWPRRHRLKL